MIFNSVIILFLIMIVGFVIRKAGVLNEPLNKGLSGLLINVTLPFMIIASFNMEYDSELMMKALKILLYSILIHAILYFVSYIFFFKFKKDKQAVLRFTATFSNTGFMGFPILGSIYGPIGVFYASIFNIPFNIFIWSLGVMLFTGKSDIKSIRKTVINPALIAVIIGIIIFRFSIKLPVPVTKSVKMIGDITTPLSMIIIGSMLANMKIKDIFSDLSIYYGAIIRLIVVPTIIYFVLTMFGVDELIVGICVILEAMPAAVITAIIAEKYEGNALYASQNVFISTVLSVITIPAIILVLGL